MRADQVPLPSGAELADYADVVNDLAEVDLESLDWEELLDVLIEICNHPVRIFACRVCDLVARGSDDDG